MLRTHGISGRPLLIMFSAAAVATELGCSPVGAGTPGGWGSPPRDPRLAVENHHWREVRVYVVHGRSARRFVGAVFGGETKTFTLPFATIGETVRILVQPVGARNESYLLPRAITLDRNVRLRIANILRQSLVWVP